MSVPEVWLRGPLPDVIPELQPVAHSLLQVREEIAAAATLSPSNSGPDPEARRRSDFTSCILREASIGC